MGRGPLLRTKLRELKKRIETEFKTRLKLYKKHPEVWLGDRLADIAKRTGITDVTKIIAVVGMTYIVKHLIDTSETLSKEVQVITRGAPFGVVGVGLSFLYEQFSPKELKAQKLEFGDEWVKWLISFTLAFIIVEHFGEIMRGVGAASSSVKSIVQGLLMGGVPAG